MKTEILLSLQCIILFSLYNTTAQCKSNIDPITGKNTSTFINYYEDVKYEKIDNSDAINLSLRFKYSGEHNVKITENTPVIIKLKDGAIVTLNTYKAAVPKTQVYASQTTASVSTFYTFFFQLNSKELSLLANSKVDLIRYPSPEGGTIDFKSYNMITGSFKKAITKGANCILQN